MLRIVVADDEPHARADLVELLAAHADCEVVATCATGADTLAAVARLHPDVLLLDIRMPGVDGFGVVERLERTDAPYVIFVTAFDRYAVDAFRVRALDYLLKPVLPARLADALGRAREQVRLRAPTPRNAVSPAPPHYWTELLVRIGLRDVVVRVDDVDWIEADTYCVRLHAGARTHVLRERMHVLASHLDPRQFARVHRSAIVNLNRVREIAHDGRGDHVIVLSTGARVRTSHARWLAFRDMMRERTRPGRTGAPPEIRSDRPR